MAGRAAAGEQIAQIEGPGGLSTRRSCTSSTGEEKSCQVVDALGSVTVFEFSSSGSEVRVRDPLGGVLLKGDDGSGRLVQVPRNGRPAGTFSWDDEGRLTSVVYPGGIARGLEWKDGRLAEVRGAILSLRFDYDARGLCSGVTDENGGRHTFARDECGRLVEENGPRGDVRRYEYDSSGNIVSVTDATVGTERFERGPDGLVSSATDAAGNVTKFTWDAAGDLYTRTDPLGNSQEWTWDERELLATHRDALGRVARMVYDYCGALSSINRTSASGAGAKTLRFERDPRGLPVAVTGPTGTERMEWDAMGRLARVVDEAGTVEEWIRDDAGRAVERRVNGATEWNGTYDKSGRLVKELLRDGSESSRVYDDNGRVVRMQEPDRTLVFVHGKDGSVRAEDPEHDIRYRFRPYGLDGTLRLDVVEGPGERRETWT